MIFSTFRDQCWQQQGGADCCSSSSSSSLTTDKLMMDARGRMGGTIGDVATSAHLHICKIAPAAEKPSAAIKWQMTNGAADPTAPVAAVLGGSKSHQRKGEASTMRGMTLTIVLSGRQPTAPLASPSTSTRAARAASATTTVRMKAETFIIQEVMWPPAATPAHVSRRGRGTLGMALTSK